MTPGPLVVSEEQVHWFRARRQHLAGPGAAGPRAAARAMVGAQAQQEPPALLALSQRTRGRPVAASLKAALFESPRSLVRTWGQRDTLQVFDPDDWATVVAARGDWAAGSRRGAMPSAASARRARKALHGFDRPVTRKDFARFVPAKLLAEAREKMGPGDGALRFAAGRLLWQLANEGDACLTAKAGSEQPYASRALWFPELAWPDSPDAAPDAAARLASRYLAAYGPATAADVAHFFGALVSRARDWLERVDRREGLRPVQCGDRPGLVIRGEDAAALRQTPPRSVKEWPVRLLPMWDNLLMGHADKSWTVPDESARKLVWRKAAMVAPVVLARGRFVATWSHRARAKSVSVTVQPLPGWRERAHAAGVGREAVNVARHLGVPDAEVTIES